MSVYTVPKSTHIIIPRDSHKYSILLPTLTMLARPRFTKFFEGFEINDIDH